VGVSTSPRRTLLEPGHEAEWAEINREKSEYHRTHARALTPAERIEEGQRLSQQAVSLLNASVKAGHAPRRALWS
jgi:mannose/cellobiose epimerase-like protein (N-acyl-D-glucosamine 2-epimerase family)